MSGSNGGKARAEKLTAEQRKEIAKRAASARWNSDVPIAEFEGMVPFGDMEIPCAVLPGGKRVLSERGVTKGLGLKRAGSNWQRDAEDGARMPVFLSAKNLEPFVSDELRQMLITPIPYRSRSTPIAVGNGIEAKVIPMICDVWLAARDAGVLVKQQWHVAVQAEIVKNGLATVGIIALVDEATGYQNVRARNALAEILEAFIKDEAGKWAKRFPDAFYQHLFRLKGKQWPFAINPPQYVGHWTNNIVYLRLAPGVLEDLRKKNPRTESGNRKRKFHQWLTEDIGHPKLQEHIQAVLALMRASDTWEQFEMMLNRALPKQPQTATERAQKTLTFQGDR